ncbi:ABC transporter permease [Tabrizicola sp. J26]|uniref:ABC transporter permease n=1 Tax=Alitabrizicola rongguiensis TaxID=2909234 RepID=UPI001F334823|nr:ABC transporter permease [Tabrizicola rongguiensis]MCF1711138.1 ABC transporter permease [Tabrizicola rongguiensis]
MKRFLDAQLLGPLAAMGLVTLVVALSTDRFLDPGNLSNLALQVSIVSLVAIGATIVIFAGGIDLSSGSMVALLTMVLATLVKTAGLPLWPTLLGVLVLGTLLGALNGVLTAFLRIPSFIVTLAGLIAYRGLALMFNAGSPIFSLDPNLEPIFYGSFLGIPLPFYYVVLFYGAATVMMINTRLGREIYAVGGNPAAAKLSGINVRRVQTWAFCIAGFMTAVGAILMSARLNSGSPNYGQTLELQAIAAAVVGGASLAGGRGNILSTLVGALTIVIVQNGLNLNAAPSAVQNVILGLIILVAVGVDMWRSEIARSIGGLLRGRMSKAEEVRRGT